MGAWIETIDLGEVQNKYKVAPCMGAWIETFCRHRYVIPGSVAPCMGAWIETWGAAKQMQSGVESHPVWVRGLKHGCLAFSSER